MSKRNLSGIICPKRLILAGGIWLGRTGVYVALVAVTALAGGGYEFVKDYDKLRENAGLLANDIKRAAGRIKRSIAKFLGDADNPFKK